MITNVEGSLPSLISFTFPASEISRFVLVNSDGRLLQVPLSVSYKTDVMIPSEGNKDILAFDVDVMHRYSFVKFSCFDTYYRIIVASGQ